MMGSLLANHAGSGLRAKVFLAYHASGAGVLLRVVDV